MSIPLSQLGSMQQSTSVVTENEVITVRFHSADTDASAASASDSDSDAVTSNPPNVTSSLHTDIHNARLFVGIQMEQRDSPASKSDRKPVRTSNEGAYASFVCAQSMRLQKQQLQRHSKHSHDPVEATSVPWCFQWPMFFVGYLASRRVQQVTAAFYLTICIVATCFRHTSALWYIVGGLCGDAGLRSIGGDRMAPLSLLAEIITTFLPSHPNDQIASAPRQFASMCYAGWNLVCVMVTPFIIDTDDWRVAFVTLLIIEAFMQSLEVVGISLPALFFEQVLVKKGFVSDLYLHKSYATLAEAKLKQAAGAEKLTFFNHQHIVEVSAENGDVLLQYEGTAFAGRHIFDPIRNCSLAYCFPLLGLLGLTELFFYCSVLLGVDEGIWKTFAIILAVLFASLYSIQALRLYICPALPFREMMHPHIRYAMSFIFTIPVLSIDFMITQSVLYCQIVLWICGPSILVFMIMYIKDWIEQPMSFELLNPTWLLGVIAPLAVAFELPIVYPELSELAWFWLAPGLFMWALMVFYTLSRLFFTAALPDSQRTALFLLVSSCAIATAASIYQDPQAADDFIGPYSNLSQFLHWLTTFFAIVCYLLLLSGYFCRSGFNMTYWALTFPASVLAIIWLFYYKIGNCSKAAPVTEYSTVSRCINNQDSAVLRGIVYLLITNACVSNTILILNTLLAGLQKRLFIAPPRWSPAAVVHLQHTAFRTSLFQASALVTQLQAFAAHTQQQGSSESLAVVQPSTLRLFQRPMQSMAACDCSHCRKLDPSSLIEKISELRELLSMIRVSLRAYMKMKEQVLWPAILLWIPQVEVSLRNNSQEMEMVLGQLESIRNLIGESASSDAMQLQRAKEELISVMRVIYAHLDHEEVLSSPLLHHFTDMSSANGIMKDIWEAIDITTWSSLIPWLLNHIPDHAQRMALIDTFCWSTQALGLIARWMKLSGEPFLYKTLCVDYPQLKRHSASPYTKYW